MLTTLLTKKKQALEGGAHPLAHELCGTVLEPRALARNVSSQALVSVSLPGIHPPTPFTGMWGAEKRGEDWRQNAPLEQCLDLAGRPQAGGRLVRISVGGALCGGRSMAKVWPRARGGRCGAESRSWQGLAAPHFSGHCFSLCLSGRGVKCLLYKICSQIRQCLLRWDGAGGAQVGTRTPWPGLGLAGLPDSRGLAYGIALEEGGRVGPADRAEPVHPFPALLTCWDQGSRGSNPRSPSPGLSLRHLFHVGREGGAPPPSTPQRRGQAGMRLLSVSGSPADPGDKPRHAAVPEQEAAAAGEGKRRGRETRPKDI